MKKSIGILLIFSLLLIFGSSKPLKRKHRDSNTDCILEECKFEQKIEETISEEKIEKNVTVEAKFNDFFTDVLPELRLTLSRDCEDKQNATAPKQELTAVSSLDCLTLDATGCAASLKKQFNEKVKEEYVREIKTFITKTFDTYATILKELPENDPHDMGIKDFLKLIAGDLPKLNSAVDLATLDNMFRAMHQDLKPTFSDKDSNEKSNQIFDDLLKKHSSEWPSMEELNEKRVAYINKIWNELVEDLRAVELFKRL